ncbi:diphosphomevalonate decarboxylase [Nocardia sp. CS682]|uniref:diphosphomevalonate decarboxylase n=1 Tax=Nocardia sp. CS682 TaxID=1047172 RepID=UPI001074E041|nr:diphosphomevalonate decarboxylase [Nocardia sp. CS682]QBS39522.1 diphosphomevalonate decarboxylase [Nocardia sp. CS682]
MRSATAVAYPNMALIKYWGKRDESLILPVSGSISMTLSIFPTTTSVSIVASKRPDVVILNGRYADSATHERVTRFLDLVRMSTGSSHGAVVDSTNSGATGVGLASSASGFAALAAAAAAAYGWRMDARALSRLARRGSGSACRSIFGGIVQWRAGSGAGEEGDRSSYAEPIEATALDPALVVCVVDARPKAVSSREAMRITAATSPFYLPWIACCTGDLAHMQQAIARGDLTRVGEITERNALGMHAAMLMAHPTIRYLSPHSIAVLDRIQQLRSEGVPAYATIDAGPNVVALCARNDADQVSAAVSAVAGVVAVHIAYPGPGVSVNGDIP